MAGKVYKRSEVKTMKKLLVFFVLAFLTAGALFAQIKSNSQAWVSSKTAELKSGTGFFAKRVDILNMGAELSVVQVNGNWAQVRAGSQSGWIAVSSLSARRIVSAGSSASATEVALAGKGFSQEVEDAYRTEGNLNFDGVDATEAITISLEDLEIFVTEGRLNAGE